jgi:hypothetical protein
MRKREKIRAIAERRTEFEPATEATTQLFLA